MRKLFKLSIVLVAVMLGFAYCDEPEMAAPMNGLPAFAVAVDHGVPGHFVVSGKRYGLFYEIAEAYAAEYPKEVVESHDAYFLGIESALNEGVVEMAVALTPRAEKMRGLHSMPVYSTSYVMLARKGGAHACMGGRELGEFVADASVTIPLHFAEAEGFYELRGAVADTMLHVDADDEFRLAERLSMGEFDLLVCEKNEAHVACAIYKNLCQVYEFEERLSVSVVMSSRMGLSEFAEWFEMFSASEDYEGLSMFYGDGKGVMSDLRSPRTRNAELVLGGISAYDALFMEVGEREGVDWRLLSAIAYEESGFTVDAVSGRGAMGIMQIMPITAAEFGIDSLTFDPEVNVMLAARLLKRLDRMVRFDDDTDEEDRLKIKLAAYNCGVGRVMNAMELLHGNGEQCCSWERVKECLMEMADSEFVVANNINTGCFRRYRQTLDYVDNVYERYEIYRRALKSDNVENFSGDL